MKTIHFTPMIRKIFLASVMALPLLFSGCADNNETPPPDVPFVSGQVVTVDQVKALYSGELAKPWQQRVPVEITGDWTLRGVIIASDKKDGNLYKEAFLQDGTTGLRMLFDATSGLYIGDSVLVNVKGLWLGDYGNFVQMGSEPYTDDSGNLRVSGFNMDKQVKKLSSGHVTLPEKATIQQVKSAAWLGRLVKLEEVQFDDDQMGRSWADAMADPPAAANRDLVDCSGKSLIVRTSGYASFAGEPSRRERIHRGHCHRLQQRLPTGGQRLFRGPDDREPLRICSPAPGISRGIPQPGFRELQGQRHHLHQRVAEPGLRRRWLWLAKLFSGNAYAQATGYNSQLSSMVTWLVTNPVTLSSQKVLSFETAKAYWAHTGDHQPMELLFSTDFNGNNLTTATWTPLTGGRLATKADPDHTFIPSGDILLPVQAGKSGTVAFRYSGSNSESTTFRIDNIVIKPAR